MSFAGGSSCERIRRMQANEGKKFCVGTLEDESGFCFWEGGEHTIPRRRNFVVHIRVYKEAI